MLRPTCVGAHLYELSKEEKVSKILQFLVTVPEIPEDWTNETVRQWLLDEVGHPYDAAYEADVRVDFISTERANPERVGNGCMIFQEPAKEAQ